MKLNPYIDHTLLQPTATPLDIKILCAEAMEHHFFAVCINGCYVETARRFLEGSTVQLAAVVGFPLGAMTTASKIYEAEVHVDRGADEIDMVINIGRLKYGDIHFVEAEISRIKKAIGGKVLKVIIETCYLTQEEKLLACRAVVDSGADFIKTSTGFGSGGATPEDVELIQKTIEGSIGIKASGGIRNRETATKLIALGATRLGTSSGIALIR